MRAWRTIEWMTKIIRNSRELTKRMDKSSDEIFVSQFISLERGQ